MAKATGLFWVFVKTSFKISFLLFFPPFRLIFLSQIKQQTTSKTFFCCCGRMATSLLLSTRDSSRAPTNFRKELQREAYALGLFQSKRKRRRKRRAQEGGQPPLHFSPRTSQALATRDGGGGGGLPLAAALGIPTTAAVALALGDRFLIRRRKKKTQQ